MEIVDFSNLEFTEIPIEDNPALMPIDDWKSINQQGCLMICKQVKQKPPYVNAGRLVVLRVDPVTNPFAEESVYHLGLFWELEEALLFCKSFVNQIKYARKIYN